MHPTPANMIIQFVFSIFIIIICLLNELIYKVSFFFIIIVATAAADYAASANPTNKQCFGYLMLFYLSFAFVLNNNNK